MGEIVEKIRITGDASDLKDEMKGAGQSITGSMITAQLAAQALTAAMNKAWESIKEGVGFALDLERTTLALKAALRGSGQEVEENAALLDRQSAALETLVGISDETIRSAQAFAINTGVSVDRIDEFTRAAISLSNTIGGDVKSAMTVLVKLQTGIIDRNLKLIPGITELTKEQLKAGDAVALVNEAWGENIDLLNQGYVGQLNALDIEWDNLKESMGEAAIEAVAATFALGDDDGGGLIGAVTSLNAAFRKMFLEGVTDKEIKAFFGDFIGSVADAHRKIGRMLGFDIAESEREVSARLEAAATFTEVTADDVAPKPPKEPTRAPAGGRRRKAAQRKIAPDTGRAAEVSARDEEIADMRARREEDLRFEEEHSDRLAEVLQSRADREEELEAMRTERAASHLEAKNELLEQETEFFEEQADKRTRIAEEEADRRAEITAAMADVITGAMGGMANALLDGLVALAEGSEVSFDKIAKDFLVSTGRQLIGAGIQHTLSGAASLLLGNPAGAGLLAIGGTELGVGALMMAGGLAIQAPQTQAIVTPSERARATPGGAAGGGGGLAFGGQQQQQIGGRAGGGQNAPTAIFVFGELTAQQAITLRRELDRNASRGF